MIRIAVCDDEEYTGRLIYDKVKKLICEQEGVYEVKLFTRAVNLLYEIEDGAYFDLLLLDIEMPDLDGMKLSETIKAYLPLVLTIFITSHEKYVYESFKVQPFRYIPKPLFDRMMPSALKDAICLIKKYDGIFFIAENKDGIEKIDIRNITYIWHREKYAYIEKKDGSRIKVRKTLKQVYSELPMDDFIWIDRGCICNIVHISKINCGDILLNDGTRLQISKDRISDVKSRLRKYGTKRAYIE